jgi:AcrR family transcriptional regulator
MTKRKRNAPRTDGYIAIRPANHGTFVQSCRGPLRAAYVACHSTALRGWDAHPTKIRILDSAQELFAARGYHGVSIREITQAADVEVALAYYHFGPKEALFRQVVMRRIDEHCTGLLQELERAQAAAPSGIASVEAVVRASCRFSFLKSADASWKRYLQLLARTSQLPMYEPALATIFMHSPASRN